MPHSPLPVVPSATSPPDSPPWPPRQHGGPHAGGVARFDFSVNSNACGPCPAALQAVQQADATRYPDPHYHALRERLAQWHGVSAARILVAASASEWISRFTLWARQYGVQQVCIPAHAYGDYAHAARCHALPVHISPITPPAAAGLTLPAIQPTSQLISQPTTPPANSPAPPPLSADAATSRPPTLHWVCQPSSPLGQMAAMPAPGAHSHVVVDCAYAPLCLEPHAWPSPSAHDSKADQTGPLAAPLSGSAPRPGDKGLAAPFAPPPPAHTDAHAYADARSSHQASDQTVHPTNDWPAPSAPPTARMLAALHQQNPHAWHLLTPNKALGLTGVRAAYAIAPAHVPAAALAWLDALAPSWPLGAHGCALLQCWPDASVQHWLHHSHHTLRQWKHQQQQMLQALGWQCLPSTTSFFCARPPQPLTPRQHHALHTGGVQLRDCTSFGLPGWWRLSVQPPAAQLALQQALLA